MNKFMLPMLQKYIDKFKHNYTKNNKLNINNTTQAWFDNNMYVIYNTNDKEATHYTLDEIIVVLLSDKSLLLEIMSKM